MSTTTIVETTTEVEEVVTETSPVNQLDEQQELRIVYDVNGVPHLVDAQGWEINVVSTNPQDQGDLQHLSLGHSSKTEFQETLKQKLWPGIPSC